MALTGLFIQLFEDTIFYFIINEITRIILILIYLFPIKTPHFYNVQTQKYKN